jgi:hypothetical protein
MQAMFDPSASGQSVSACWVDRYQFIVPGTGGKDASSSLRIVGAPHLTNRSVNVGQFVVGSCGRVSAETRLMRPVTRLTIMVVTI